MKSLFTPVPAALLALGALHAVPARSAEAQQQAPGFYRMMLGDFEITALSDGTAPQPMDKILTRITPQELDRLARRGFLSFPAETSINAFLINTGSALVLVDSGAGSVFGPDVAGRVLKNLAASGYRPEQIDAILITHLHSDHSGGLAAQGKRLFPNATVYAHENEVGYWLDPAKESEAPAERKGLFKTAREMLEPYRAAGKLKTFRDGEIVPGIRAEPTPGHTPGHSFYVAQSKGETLKFWGDLIHVAEVQFPAPGTAILYDSDQDEAVRRRATAMRDAADKGYWVAAPHISFPGIGHVRTAETGYDWVPAAYSLNGLKP